MPSTNYLALGGDRTQQILQPDTPKHLRADTIGDAVDDFRPILGGIHMDAKWPLAEGCVDHVHDGHGD